MKKIVKTVTKHVNEEVMVCDTCRNEVPLPISWNWSMHCPYDNCYDDYGDCQFCSVECFVKGVGKAVESLDGDDFFSQRFTLKFEGSGHGDQQDVIELLKKLQKAA